jgi:hypothetical protein
MRPQGQLSTSTRRRRRHAESGIGLTTLGAGTAGIGGAAAASRRGREGMRDPDGPAYQMRWKFFSISRRVMRRTTGRPCGQTLE